MNGTKRSTTFFRLAVATALSAVVCVASASFASSFAFDEVEESPSSPSSEYPTNKDGMTFGSDFGQDESPDLVLARGDDGTVGYVKRQDVYGPDDVTLEDVLRQMEAGDPESRTIPLYAEDGTTVIGKFTLPPPTGGDGSD